MTQVSRFRLTPDTYDRIFRLFIETLLAINDREKLGGFINNFFTPTERIMFAKRLAASVMLAKGNSYENIRRTLRISPPTIARMSMQINYEGTTLMSIVEDILRRDKARIIFEELMSMFDLPGKGRSFRGLAEIKKNRKERVGKLKHEF